MKTKTSLLAVFSAAVLAIGVTAVVLINQPARAPKTQTPTTASQQTPNVAGSQTQTIEFTAEKGTDVLTQLKTRASVVTKDSEFGPFVESINGIVGGTDGKYWSFYVNGEYSQVGAADYVTEGGEKIEWKFE